MGVSSTASALFGVVAVAAVIGLFGRSWSRFLDRCEHDPARVRLAMGVLLAVASTGECWLVAGGMIRPWVLAVTLVANLWGGVDAVLRFPASHDVESLFAVKQFLLLMAKAYAYGTGLIAFRRNMVIFAMLVLFNIVGLPVFYAMAMPMDPREQVVRNDDHNVDLLVRFWQIAACPTERRACIASCRCWWYRRLADASDSSRLARLAISAAASPVQRRALRRRGGRSV